MKLFTVLVVGVIGLILAASLCTFAYAVSGLRNFAVNDQAFCVQLPQKNVVRSIWQLSPFSMMEEGALTHFKSALIYGTKYGQNHARVLVHAADGRLPVYHWSYRSLVFEPKALVTEVMGGSHVLEELPNTVFTDDFVCEPSKNFISTLRWY